MGSYLLTQSAKNSKTISKLESHPTCLNISDHKMAIGGIATHSGSLDGFAISAKSMDSERPDS
jgi:hypothetical protein